MRHRRDVLDVLSLIDQSTVDLSVFDTSVCVAADPKWSRPVAAGHAVDPQLELALGFSIGG
jgi:hypothetical protein